MPRSWYDFGNIDTLLSGKQIDNSELAYLLSEVMLLDGLGRTLFLTDFRHGVGGFEFGLSGIGQLPYIIGNGIVPNAELFKAGYGLKFSPGIVNGDKSYIGRSFMLHDQKKIGLEIGIVYTRFSPDIVAFIDYRPDNLSAKIGVIKFQPRYNLLQIYTDSGYITVHTMDAITVGNLFKSQIKFVCNWDTGKYKRLLIDDKGIDISMHNLATSGVGFDGFIALQVRGDSYGAGTTTFQLGYIRLSKDEP